MPPVGDITSRGVVAFLVNFIQPWAPNKWANFLDLNCFGI